MIIFLLNKSNIWKVWWMDEFNKLAKISLSMRAEHHRFWFQTKEHNFAIYFLFYNNQNKNKRNWLRKSRVWDLIVNSLNCLFLILLSRIWNGNNGISLFSTIQPSKNMKICSLSKWKHKNSMNSRIFVLSGLKKWRKWRKQNRFHI